MTPGLANKIAIPSAAKICCNFPETLDCLPEGKAVLTGSPIRQELLSGNKIAAMDLCKFTADKPVILVIGGSLGSVVVNNAVRESLPCLLKDFQIIQFMRKRKNRWIFKKHKRILSIWICKRWASRHFCIIRDCHLQSRCKRNNANSLLLGNQTFWFRFLPKQAVEIRY